MIYIGIAKKMKSFQNDLKRKYGPLKNFSQGHQLQMCTLKDIVCMDYSQENMLDRGKAKKMEIFYNDLKIIYGPLNM